MAGLLIGKITVGILSRRGTMRRIFLPLFQMSSAALPDEAL
jgi:hypothetical protein